VKRILIIYRRGIGDVLRASMLSPILKSIYPNAKIDAFVRTPVSAQILRNDPNINRLLIYDRNARPLERVKILSQILRTKYDVTLVCFPSGFLSNLVALLSGAGKRIGFVRDRLSAIFRSLLLTDIPPMSDERHELVRNLELLKPLGYDYRESDKRMVLYLSEKDYSEAKNFFTGHALERFSFIVGMAPGSSSGQSEKRWPIEKYAEVSDWIKENYNAEVIVFENATDKSELQSIQKMSEVSRRGFIKVSGLSLGTATTLMKSCSVFLCNDNGGMHMAASVQVPIIAVFGPSDPETARPLGTQHFIVQALHLECCPCWAPEMGIINCTNSNRLACMKDVSTERIKELLKSILSMQDENAVCQ
jgi:lipopolysaccharide heptosyltransferase II